jgi:hypothetical protein
VRSHAASAIIPPTAALASMANSTRDRR